jgi:hypothetical protein
METSHDACKEYHESLMLDVMGEPDPDKGLHWQAHLNGCEACHSERMRLTTLLEEMKKNASPPRLPEAGVESFAQRISWTLRNERIQAGLKQQPRATIVRRIPAMVALCILLVFGTFLWYRGEGRLFRSEQAGDRRAEMALPKQDQDVIKNLDMLRDLETIRMLVQTIDHPDNTGKNAPKIHQDTRGTLKPNGGGIHA